MAQTDDRSASAMPRVLVIIAAVLLVFRLAADVVSIAAKPHQQAPVAWERADGLAALPPPSDKPVIYQFYADWSDACNSMDSSVLSNGQIKQTIEQRFRAIRIYDLPKGKNPQWVSDLEKRYRIFALPTLVVVNPDGKQVCSLIGNCSSLTTYRFLSRALHLQESGTGPLRIRPTTERATANARFRKARAQPCEEETCQSLLAGNVQP